MQQPMKPTIEAIVVTIIRPRRTKGCFKTIAKLEVIASTAFRLPKIIRGMVNMVKNDIDRVIKEPTSWIPE